jgi:site-specific recombinase XerC
VLLHFLRNAKELSPSCWIVVLEVSSLATRDEVAIALSLLLEVAFVGCVGVVVTGRKIQKSIGSSRQGNHSRPDIAPSATWQLFAQKLSHTHTYNRVGELLGHSYIMKE